MTSQNSSKVQVMKEKSNMKKFLVLICVLFPLLVFGQRAGECEITIEQGATFNMEIVWTESGDSVDITNYSIEMQVRKYVGSTDTLMTANTTRGDIVISTTETGTIAFNVSAARTALLDFTSATWDILYTSSAGVVTRLLQGPAFLSKGVTR